MVGFELSRSFRPLNYSLAPKKADTGLGSILSALQPTNTVINGIGGILSSSLGDLLLGVHLSPQELEQELGGPFVNNFNAVTQTNGVGVPESYATGFLPSPTPLPSSSYPIPALQVAPLLRFNDLLKIEQCLQHVVKNTITYSRSVWMSLTPEERVIMLEGYTIGVPAGGIADDTQNIPLLNCISNQVLGYYGNSLIFPFTIPIEVAEKIGFKGEGQDKAVPLTTGAIQQVLGDYHKNGFSPPVSRIALPTHGVLGEAILGHCSSAEKIDLRRFWNWQDSPIPQATDINPVTINRGTGLEAATAANTLTGLPSIINNLTLPSGDSALAQALIAGQDKTPFQNITGGAELATLQGKTLDTAESARAGALAAAQSLATKALEQVPNILSAQAKAKESQKADDAKAQEDQTKKQDAQSKSQDDATTKRNDRLKAAVESLKGNAKTYQDVADAKTNQGEADAFAKSVVKASLGGVDLTADWGAQLFDAYKDGAAHPKGSPAFLAALGLK